MALTKITGTGLETLSDGVTITTADNTTQLTLASTDADASVGPVLDLYRNSSSPADGDRLGSMTIRGRNDNSQDVTYATFRAFAADVSDGSEDTEFEFTTILAGAEVARMTTVATETVFNQAGADIDFRVEGSGLVNLFKVDAGAGSGKVGINCDPTDLFYITGQATSTAMGIKIGTNGYNAIEFDNATGSLVGRITTSASSTAYVTSSDYRLKENVADMTGATARLKQLKPKRFNWITDGTNTLVDGFLAHEVSSIVPEAITGAKDAVHPVGHHEAGEIDAQGIDHSKLVPLLVKTIQELEARITALE